eukprot:TRINITY_DN4005_c0_g1_i1.p1 TRINITY_DN4005_c0_g1~~TRINITY_DN4005_c0_g1_i1.p1  ORF type:complete len:457 (-),score=147.48 TRINITY_DN4005_c0_g1_i1:934-2304(-)
MFYQEDSEGSDDSGPLPGSSEDAAPPLPRRATDAAMREKLQRLRVASSHSRPAHAMRGGLFSPKGPASFTTPHRLTMREKSELEKKEIFDDDDESSDEERDGPVSDVGGRSLMDDFLQTGSVPPGKTRDEIRAQYEDDIRRDRERREREKSDSDIPLYHEDVESSLREKGISSFYRARGSAGTSAWTPKKEKLSKKEDEIDMLDLKNPRDMLMRPIPPGKIIRCQIVRDRKGLKRFHPRYYLRTESGQFLLAAKLRGGKRTTSYLVSVSDDDFSRDGSSFFGKLRSNFVGTQFSLFDDGANPFRKMPTGASPRKELGFVLFESNVLGNKGPRKMTVLIPKVGDDGKSLAMAPLKSGDSLHEKYRQADLGEMYTLRNKEPVWNDRLRAFVLNFHGRVTQASVKNFQLVNPEDDSSDFLLLFGRVDKNLFNLDFRFPFSPLQAFLVALASLDRKLACE